MTVSAVSQADCSMGCTVCTGPVMWHHNFEMEISFFEAEWEPDL